MIFVRGTNCAVVVVDGFCGYSRQSAALINYNGRQNEMRHMGRLSGVCHFGRLQRTNGYDTLVDPMPHFGWLDSEMLISEVVLWMVRGERRCTTSDDFRGAPLWTASTDEWIQHFGGPGVLFWMMRGRMRCAA
ncbi:hypothetical protein JCGZ_00459 [Jatropha curcas]|uniref:Uncharacterized protein n=1 Tax=Jatropha curcas TaxID=180498 RepID=A0A067JJW7_JATCU|nr:hypothetical protein JCGZ_00459 [Jatropha curcas]